jgi:hypothetical protein
MTAAGAAACPPTLGGGRPPVWLFAATAVLALVVLALAVAETTLWMHYLIDGGESLSLVGLVFILVGGIHLYRQGRLLVSLPLVAPWLLYPVITQGNQIIDNLSINGMRAIVQILLAAIFAAPVAVVALAVWYRARPTRERMSMLVAALLALEIWIAHQFLGTLMVITLVIMVVAVLAYGSVARAAPPRSRRQSERFALATLLVGVAVSVGLYVGFKNRPGAYQGSPSEFMDPSRNVGYRLDLIPVPARAATTPGDPAPAREVLAAYGRALERLLAGYYVLDRNYTWHFHNELFLRHTPLLPDYRSAGLRQVAEAQSLRREADVRAAAVRPTLADDDPLAALLDDVAAYVAFHFDRAPRLETMSAEFDRTKAGLQHSAHLYEGEGKFLSARFGALLQKHRAVIDSPAVASVTGEFAAVGGAIAEAYADRIVGF